MGFKRGNRGRCGSLRVMVSTVDSTFVVIVPTLVVSRGLDDTGRHRVIDTPSSRSHVPILNDISFS